MTIFFRILLSLFCLAAYAVKAQEQPIDTLLGRADGKLYLLEDKRVKNETTDAINALYNFNFEKADLEFRYLEVKYPDHPLPTFLLGLMEWWKIVPNTEDEQFDARFIELMTKSIDKAQKLWDRDEGNLEAAFFLSGGYGFRGRLHADRKNWRRAINDGRAALRWLNVSKGKEKFSREFLFGDALFNYYRVYIHDNLPLLRPILAFFPKGSKEIGLQQLTRVTLEAFYTRTEAQTYLMRIYANEEGNPGKSIQVSEYLNQTFPNNPYFQRTHARNLYQMGRLSDCFILSQDIHKKCEANQFGYEANSMRLASYFLGYVQMRRFNDKPKAISYFEQSIQAGDKAKQQSSGYTLYAHIYSAQLYEQLGNEEKARSLMQEVKKRAEKKEDAYKEADKWLDDHAPKRKKFLGIF